MRFPLRLALLLSIPLAACDAGGPLPLDLEVQDGIAAGGKLDELMLVVKTNPGTQVKVEGQTKDSGDRGTATFVLPKGKLKLGNNTFTVTATQSSLFGAQTATKAASWVAGPKGLLRFYAPSAGDFEADVNCGGIMCGQPSLRATRDGTLPLEIESAVVGMAYIDGQKTNLSPDRRGKLALDLNRKLGTLAIGKEDFSLPILMEGDGATTDILDVSGAVMTTLATRVLARVEKGPVLFPGEAPGSTPAKPRLLVAVGVPASNLIVDGPPGKYQDIDLVAVAKPVEPAHFFGCGKGEGGPGILYGDLDVKVYDRRSGAVVGTRKLRADRVPCPPVPSGVVKADVRVDDVKRVLGELIPK